MSQDLKLSESQARRASQAITRLEKAVSDLDKVFREASVQRAQEHVEEGER